MNFVTRKIKIFGAYRDVTDRAVNICLFQLKNMTKTVISIGFIIDSNAFFVTVDASKIVYLFRRSQTGKERQKVMTLKRTNK